MHRSLKIYRFQYAPVGTGSTVRHPTPSAPWPCHAQLTHQPAVSPAKENCRRCPTRRTGDVERRPPGDGSLASREGGEGFPNTSGDVSLPGSPPHQFQHNYTYSNFKIDRLHSKFKVKIYSKSKIIYFTLISIYFYINREKNRKNVQKWISETGVRIEKQSKVNEIAAPTLNPT